MKHYEIVSKLGALRNTVDKLTESPHAQYFDPKIVLDLFTRYIPIRDILKSEFSSVFGDLPIRETPEPSKTTDFDGRGYIVRKDLSMLRVDIEYCLDILAKMPTVDIPSMKVTREGVFFAGEYFDATRQIGEMFSQSRQTIIIIDGYISPKVLDLLTSKNASVEAQILTYNLSPALKTAAHAFNKQYGKLFIRTSNAFHDRFIIIDDCDFFHFGASIKDLGSKGFMFSRIEEPEVIERLRKKWTDEWAKAKEEV